jgi:hypothetical protein
MHGKLIALGKLKLASLLRCGKNPSVGKRRNQRRFLGHNKTLQGKPIVEPHGGRTGAWRRLNLVQGIAGNTKYCSSNLVVDFLHDP